MVIGNNMNNIITDLKNLELETLKNLRQSRASNTLRAYQSDYKDFAAFCKVSPCKINLIEYNTVDDFPYEKSTNKVTENFISYLEEKNLIVNLRKSKGKDINAACGQLVNKLQ